MARRKSKAVAIILAIVLIVLFTGAIGACAWLTNGFQDEPKTFGVTVNGKLYVNNVDNLVLDKQTTITVTTPFSDGYEAVIYTKALADNFTFKVGDEEYNWADTHTMPFNAGFVFVVDGDTFTLSYTNLAGIIATVLDYNVNDICVPDAPDGDLFEMRITSGNSTITLGFTLTDLGGNANVSGIILDEDEIIF